MTKLLILFIRVLLTVCLTFTDWLDSVAVLSYNTDICVLLTASAAAYRLVINLSGARRSAAAAEAIAVSYTFDTESVCSEFGAAATRNLGVINSSTGTTGQSSYQYYIIAQIGTQRVQRKRREKDFRQFKYVSILQNYIMWECRRGNRESKL